MRPEAAVHQRRASREAAAEVLEQLKDEGIKLVADLPTAPEQTDFAEVVEKAAKADAVFVYLNEAGRHGVPHDALYALAASVSEEIIKVASDKGCDLIFMASHGRRGFRGLLLGSETMHVLTRCKIPVLVYR